MMIEFFLLMLHLDGCRKKQITIKAIWLTKDRPEHGIAAEDHTLVNRSSLLPSPLVCLFLALWNSVNVCVC